MSDKVASYCRILKSSSIIGGSKEEGHQEECIALVTRLLRRKFGIQPEFEALLPQLQALPIEKLEELTEVIFDWADLSDLAEWLRR